MNRKTLFLSIQFLGSYTDCFRNLAQLKNENIQTFVTDLNSLTSVTNRCLKMTLSFDTTLKKTVKKEQNKSKKPTEGMIHLKNRFSQCFSAIHNNSYRKDVTFFAISLRNFQSIAQIHKSFSINLSI